MWFVYIFVAHEMIGYRLEFMKVQFIVIEIFVFQLNLNWELELGVAYLVPRDIL